VNGGNRRSENGDKNAMRHNPLYSSCSATA
jgi:hypothetical protein